MQLDMTGICPKKKHVFDYKTPLLTPGLESVVNSGHQIFHATSRFT